MKSIDSPTSVRDAELSWHFRHPDEELLWTRFKDKAPDLFIPESGESRISAIDIAPTCKRGAACEDVIQNLAGSKNIESSVVQQISTITELHGLLRHRLTYNSIRILVLERLNSWSRINITFEMFQAIYFSVDLTPMFLSIVMGLGRKLSSKDEDFMSCYSSTYTRGPPEPIINTSSCGIDRGNALSVDTVFELAYNIRHFELHGRELEDPWSCRQTAIHHIFYSENRSSNWVIIQPPKKFENSLLGVRNQTDGHPMRLHLRYLVAGAINWRDYLNYLAERLKDLDSQVAIFKPLKDFGLNFSSKQRIHTLRRKLHHAHAILCNTLKTVSRISAHEKTLAAASIIDPSTHINFQQELYNLRTDLENYKQTVQKLLNVSKDIRLLYDDILKLHGQELLHQNGLQLAQIAQSDSHDTKAMTALADKTYKDSRTIRIATLVAMFYLPANLVMSFFSTTLVWFESADGAGGSELNASLRIHREMWIAILTIVMLTLGTLGLSWWWEREEKKSPTPHVI